jgi:hypothetical protein
MKVGMALKLAKVKLRQPNQQEGMKKAESPQFKRIASGDWAGPKNHHLRHSDFHEILRYLQKEDSGTSRVFFLLNLEELFFVPPI